MTVHLNQLRALLMRFLNCSVPIVLAGAKITAEQLLSEQGIRIPWRSWRRPRPTISSKLDFVYDPLDALIGPGLVILPALLILIIGLLVMFLSRLE